MSRKHTDASPPCVPPFDQGGVAQMVNLAAFLAATQLAAASYCTMFSTARVWLNFVMWSCWNIVCP